MFFFLLLLLFVKLDGHLSNITKGPRPQRPKTQVAPFNLQLSKIACQCIAVTITTISMLIIQNVKARHT